MSETDYLVDIEMNFDVDLKSVIATLGCFGQNPYRSFREVTGYLEEDSSKYLETLRHLNYVTEMEGSYKLSEDRAIRRDAERIHGYITKNYNGHAPSFIDSFLEDKRAIDAITETLDLTQI